MITKGGVMLLKGALALSVALVVGGICLFATTPPVTEQNAVSPLHFAGFMMAVLGGLSIIAILGIMWAPSKEKTNQKEEGA